jgi:hypothetical protein
VSSWKRRRKMKEVIVRLTGDYIKVKGGEYVQDLVRCKECASKDEICNYCHKLGIFINPVGNEFCSYGEVRDE